MAIDLFRASAIWFYGVIVGLALDEGLSRILPHLFVVRVTESTAYTLLSLEGMRLTVFLVMTVRFYFGALVYMQRCDDSTYRLDFLLGLFHFLLFYVWALCLPVNPEPFTGKPLAADGTELLVPVQYFVIMLFVILLYDVFWFFLTTGLQAKPHYMLRIWTTVNLVTFLIAGFGYMVLKHALTLGQWWAEAWVASVVLLASAFDLTELVQNKGIFRNLLKGIIGNEDDPPPGS